MSAFDDNTRRDLFRAGQRLHRMLGPWTLLEKIWYRADVTGDTKVEVYPQFGGDCEVSIALRPSMRNMKGTQEDAKAAADKALTEAGWELVD